MTDAAGLQNHPGDVEFPVRPRRRHTAEQNARRLADKRQRGRRALGLTAIAAPFGIAGFAVAVAQFPTGELFLSFYGFALAFFVGLFVAIIIFGARDSRAPRRAQLAYLASSGRLPLTLRQEQILALDASSDFSFRGWNSSLAFVPTFAELSPDLRARFRDGHDTSPWPAMPVAPLQSHRAALDEQFKIASTTDAELFAADSAGGGHLSARFAEVAASETGDHMMSRMAALTDRPVFDIIELTRGTDGSPPRLLLAGDTERTIGGIRYAFVAGYLTADDAWRLLEPVAARAFAVYRGWNEYWRDVLVATAFRTDSLGAVQAQRDNLEKLFASKWPAASTPFPAA